MRRSVSLPTRFKPLESHTTLEVSFCEEGDTRGLSLSCETHRKKFMYCSSSYDCRVIVKDLEPGFESRHPKCLYINTEISGSPSVFTRTLISNFQRKGLHLGVFTVVLIPLSTGVSVYGSLNSIVRTFLLSV